MGEIQRGRVRFRLPSICRFEIGPFDKQLTRVRMHKIKLPANCTLLASIRASWQYLVLQRQGVFLAVTVINANAEPFITTQIQVEGPDSPLRGEPSASKRRDVEMTMELCWPNILALQIRLTAAPSYAVVRSGPSAGLPRLITSKQKRYVSVGHCMQNCRACSVWGVSHWCIGVIVNFSYGHMETDKPSLTVLGSMPF